MCLRDAPDPVHTCAEHRCVSILGTNRAPVKISHCRCDETKIFERSFKPNQSAPIPTVKHGGGSIVLYARISSSGPDLLDEIEGRTDEAEHRADGARKPDRQDERFGLIEASLSWCRVFAALFFR